MVAYICKYFIGQLIPIIQTVTVALGIKDPLEYVSAGIGYNPCFFTFIYKYKEKLVILQSIGIIVIKVRKQG